MTFQFTPTDGYRNVVSFPTKPANETAFRDSMQDLLDQVRDYINGNVPSTPNRMINGNFDVWQRGTPFINPTTPSYTADRFLISYNVDGGILPATITHTRLPINGELSGSVYGYRVQPDGAGSAFGVNSSYGIFQRIENGTRYFCGSGKKLTVSFWARCSIPGKKIGISASQRYGTGGAPSANETLTGQTMDLTGIWAQYSFTLTTATLSGKTFGTDDNDYLQIGLIIQWGSTAGSGFGIGATTEGFRGSCTLDIAQLQITIGDSAVEFQPRPFNEELFLCQRYYEKSYNYSNAPATVTSNGYNLIGIASNADNVTTNISFNVKKRAVPTISLFHADGTFDAVGKTISNTKVSGLTQVIKGETGLGQISKTASFTTGDVVMAHWTAESEL